MARHGVTYDDVAEAAERLIDEGVVGPDGMPTISAIRTALGGTGSPNTIHAHLKAWKAKRPAPAAAASELPAGLVNALRNELQRVAAEVRAESANKLAAALDEAEALAAAGQQLDAELEAMSKQLASAQSERDQLDGQCKQQAAEIERLQQAMKDLRKDAEDTRLELAKAQLSATGTAVLVEQLRSDEEKLRREHNEERDQRIEAERKLAASEASLKELQVRLRQLDEGEQMGRAEAAKLRKALDDEKLAHAGTKETLATAIEKARAEEARANDLLRREEDLRKQLLDGSKAAQS